MIYPEELVNLFKKHGFWQVSLFLFVMACVSLVLFIVFANGIALVNAVWCSANIYGIYVICKEKESHEATKEKLADAKDNLCIVEHKADSLRLELETTQAALEEAQKRASSRAVVVHSGPASARVNVAFADKPEGKPDVKASKRKPAARRKPKTEKTNEKNLD